MRYLYLILLMMITALTHAQYSFLALGDSYTIGEAVLPKDNFPNQVVAQMRAKGVDMEDVEIIAKTGWTTFELSGYLDKNPPEQPKYDFVSLLIGVNNQYRGLSAEQYSKEFRSLLMRAISYAGGVKERVVVLSIPDWGVTPFAEGRDRAKIAEEIDLFNAINKRITEDAGVFYIDITPLTREAATDLGMLAEDGLHPGSKDYARWASLVVKWMEMRMAAEE
jgi:lysophospholipase L1-like esterase